MKEENKIKYFKTTLIATGIVVMLLSLVFVCMIAYIYNHAEENAFERLHMQTLTIKENINLQIESDAENLTTMANFAAKLYSDGEDFSLLFDSFKAIGLIENIGILKPDNVFVTKMGEIDLNGKISFSEEVLKGKHISGRVQDLTNPGFEIIRSGVPVISEGKAVGILYGVIKLDKFEEKYAPLAKEQKAQLFVLEASNGNFIVDTWNEKLGNLSDLSKSTYKEGFSYHSLNNAMINRVSGYTSFVSRKTDKYLYAHFAPLGVSDWNIMLAEPDDKVFGEVRKLRHDFLIMVFFVVMIMVLYLLTIIIGEKKRSKLNICASEIRKILLGINYHFNSSIAALEKITDFSNSRSAFFVDTDDEEQIYIVPELRHELLRGEDRRYFILLLIEIAKSVLEENKADIAAFEITSKDITCMDLKARTFLQQHHINSIVLKAVSDKEKHLSIIGTVNPKKNAEALELLKDIAVCFSMAIYNKKYLNRTEILAATDSLTGLANRVEYKRNIAKFNEEIIQNLACVYIDVNELHMVNNNFGHQAGDEMLIFIAHTLKDAFKNEYVYRMGGDEFLVFVQNSGNELFNTIDSVNRIIEEKGYHISIGCEFYLMGEEVESLVKRAEKKMYEAKAKYYQEKEQYNISNIKNGIAEYISTGIPEIDATLSVMTRHYYAIFCVMLEDDKAQCVLMSSYFKQLIQKGENFSETMLRYVYRMVDSDYHRAMVGFLKYDVLKSQLSKEAVPTMVYKRIDGEEIKLSIYALPEDGNINETIWVFEKA